MNFENELEQMPEDEVERVERLVDDLMENGFPKYFTAKRRSEYRLMLTTMIDNVIKKK